MSKFSLERKDDIVLTDQEIFQKIWTAPRLVFRYIHDGRYNKFTWILLALAGILRSLNRAIEKNKGDEMELTSILLIAILVGGALGWIGFYIYAGLMSLCSGWLKGKADTHELVRVMAFAFIPSLFSLGIIIVQFIVLGDNLFKSDFGDYEGAFIGVWFILATSIVEVLLALYSLALLVIGVSEIQRFSIKKAALNVFLPILFIVIPILIIVMIAQIF